MRANFKRTWTFRAIFKTQKTSRLIQNNGGKKRRNALKRDEAQEYYTECRMDIISDCIAYTVCGCCMRALSCFIVAAALAVCVDKSLSIIAMTMIQFFFFIRFIIISMVITIINAVHCCIARWITSAQFEIASLAEFFVFAYFWSDIGKIQYEYQCFYDDNIFLILVDWLRQPTESIRLPNWGESIENDCVSYEISKPLFFHTGYSFCCRRYRCWCYCCCTYFPCIAFWCLVAITCTV